MLILILSVASLGAEEKNLEQYLPSDIAILASFNNFEASFDALLSSQTFQVVNSMIKEKKPDFSLNKLVAKIKSHPLFRLVKNKVVLGIIPPSEKNKKAIFIIMAKGNNIYKQLMAVNKENLKKGKLYIINQSKYKNADYIVSLEPQKGKLEKRYTLVTSDFCVISSSEKYTKECFERRLTDQLGLSLPISYKNLPHNALVKVCIDVKKFNINLDKNAKKIPGVLQPYFKKFKDFIKGTESLSLALSMKDVINLKVIRSGSPLAVSKTVPLSPSLIDRDTMAFISVPIPYLFLWDAFRTKMLKQNPRKMRKMESKLSELFDWVSFRDDVLAKIGPNTGLILQKPGVLTGKPIYIPHLAFITTTEFNFLNAFDKIWKFVSKNRKVRRHLQRGVVNYQGAGITKFNFSETPLDKLVSPSYAIFKNYFILGSHFVTVQKLITYFQNGKEKPNSKLYLYLNFQAISKFLEANIPFMRKDAEKKGKPFKEKELRKILQIIETFQYFEVSGKRLEGKDILEVTLPINK